MFGVDFGVRVAPVVGLLVFAVHLGPGFHFLRRGALLLVYSVVCLFAFAKQID